MIFKRKKSDDLSSTSEESVVNDRVKSKIETFYLVTMCFVAACLSFAALEVGARSPLGHSVTNAATFNRIFRRSYNLKIKIMVTNVIVGLITTIMLAIGDVYSIPYLYVPWLVNTMKGMIFYEGPTLLGLSYIWLPDTGIAAGTFVFLTFLLFVEEFCLWLDVFLCFKRCWLDYSKRREQPWFEPNNTLRLIQPVYDYRNKIQEHAPAKSIFRHELLGPTVDSTLTRIIPRSTFSNIMTKTMSATSINNLEPQPNCSDTKMTNSIPNYQIPLPITNQSISSS